jgi:hypothetical protein
VQRDGEPWLFLDDGQGRVVRIAGTDFAAYLADLPIRPRLIILASCDSAGDGTLAMLTALGPRLAMAGIPAVIAMQGRFSVETNAAFVPAFIEELQRDGRIDRALAAARQQVAERPDWWAPALFTRLRSGRIWYEPGFDAQDFAKWPTLVVVSHGASVRPSSARDCSTDWLARPATWPSAWRRSITSR